MTSTTPNNPRSQAITIAAFFATLGITFLAYGLGLPGQFMFDDYPNLKTLASHGGVHDLASLKLYLDDSFAGPTGRPISMLSFLIEARDWPAEAGPMKLKNILLHLLNGLVLFWLLMAALKQTKLASDARAVLWIPFLAAAFWLLHPFHVSTVLYTIQRMAELSALFVLLGMVGYVYGRQRLSMDRRKGHLIMAGSLMIFGTLGILSKENAALLPIFVLVLEATLFSSQRANRPAIWFRTLFLWLPGVGLIAYLIFSGVTANGTWVLRDFTLGERLLTEARILFQYLWYLLIPHIQTQGLFPNIQTSSSLVSPPLTLLAVLGIIGLLTLALFTRKRVPLLSAAILFFFAGHIMESTALPLELYFEHRSYLPSVLLFLPLAQLLHFGYRYVPKPSVAVAGLAILVMAGTLAVRAQAWGNPTQLYLDWAESNPHSPRAQLSAANALSSRGHPDRAIELLQEASGRIPPNLPIQLQLLRLKARNEGVSGSDLRRAAQVASSAQYTNESLTVMKQLTKSAVGEKTGVIPAQAVRRLWNALKGNKHYWSQARIKAAILHHIGWLDAHARDRQGATRHFAAALQQSGRVGTGLMEVAILGTYGYYCEALAHLDDTQALLARDPRAQQRQGYYEQAIRRLERVLNRDASKTGKSCNS